MSTLQKIQAALSISLYLVAACLPCEPPENFSFSATSAEISSRPASPSPHAAHEAARTRGHDGAPGHAAHAVTDRTSHSTSDAHSAHSGHSAHLHAASASGSQGVSPPSPDRKGEPVATESRGETSRLALRAPCLCGCSDTRGSVGGGTARLGTAVWTAAVVWLPKRSTERALVLAPRMNPAAELPRDPIPI